MEVTIDRALNIIGERVVDNNQMLKQARRQRRSEYTDIYGVPFKTEPTAGGNERFRVHLFISPDLEYWERFQFKMRVGINGSITPELFKFKVIEIDDDGEETTPIDLSEYLIEQHGEDAWVDGDGYYPSEDIGDESADTNDFYDILDACSIMEDEGRSTAVNRILGAGTKIITVDSKEDCNITFIPNIKYTTVNR